MLRITIEEAESNTTIKLEGKLAGPWVSEFERSWAALADQAERRLVVDISEVTFVDGGGRDALARMHRQGAKLIACGCMNRSIVDEIERNKQ